MKPEVLGRWMVGRWFIWQMHLLDTRGMAKFCSDRGTQVSWSSGRQIERLWQLGLLRADYAQSNKDLDGEGLIEVGSDGCDQIYYADARQIPSRSNGWVGVAAKLEDLGSEVKPFFHPFRFYVVQYLLHPVGLFSIRPNISPISTFTTAGMDSYKDLVGHLLEDFNEYSSTPAFLGYVERLNDFASLAIATEPCVFGRMFGTQRLRALYPDELGIDLEEFKELSEDERFEKGWEVHERRIAEQSAELAGYYRRAGLDRLREVHQALCIDAERLNSDKDVLTLLRLAKGRRPLGIRARVGAAALLVRIMAETVRRFSEEVFETQIPEEDERGFGFTPKDMKKDRYGSNRVLDGERSVANAFVRGFGLDYGVRVRWYVEGHTEWGALGAIFGRYCGTGVELHNLRARVVSKGRAGFESNLQTDLESKVFSFVMVDGDRKDYVEAVRNAAEEDRICGRFFIQEPDFELANFSKDELEQILWEYAEEHGAHPEEREKLHEAVKCASSGGELVEKAKKALTNRFKSFRRNQEWGERLMTIAWNHPKEPDGETRPVMQAVWAAQRGLQANFDYERANYRVDPETGDTLER